MASNSWGQLSWSAGQWGDQPDINQSVTSLGSLSISQGKANYSPADGWGRNFWGALGWGVNYANNSVSLNSFPLTLTLGDETAAGEINTGWGRGTWSSGAWGITGSVLTGSFSLTASLNSVIVVAEVNSGWGRLTWGQNDWGTNGISVIASVTGKLLSISQGDETASANADVTVSSTANVGWGVLAWGAQKWGQGQVTLALTVTEGVVDPSPDATVTGIGMAVALSIGTVIVGTGNVTVTGQALTIAKGSVVATPNTIASATGKLLTASLNSVVAGASAEVYLTGNALTVRLNNINIQSWTVINTGTDATWIEVDTAA